MAFDSGQLDQHFMDIERYLGILKGNELVKEYFQAVSDNVPAGTERHNFFTFNSLESDNAPREYELNVDFMYFMEGKPVIGDGRGSEQETYDRELRDGAKQSYDNGVRWASGMAYYLRSIVKPFTLPDVERFRSVSSDLRDRIEWVAMTVPDFASNSAEQIDFGARLDLWLVQGWQSDAAIAFNSFYDTLALRILGYSNVSIRAADLVDAVGGQVQAAQGGLLDFAERAASSLRDQCVQWGETQGNPFSFKPTDLGWVVDLVGIAKDIVDAIPIVDKVAKLPGTVVETTENIGKLIKSGELIDKYTTVPEGQRRLKEFTLESADKFYDDLTSTLYDDLYQGYNTGLMHIQTERSQILFGQVQALTDPEAGDWYPPQVNNIENAKHW